MDAFLVLNLWEILGQVVRNFQIWNTAAPRFHRIRKKMQKEKFDLHFKEEAPYLEVKALGYSKGIGASDLILLLQKTRRGCARPVLISFEKKGFDCRSRT